MKRSRLIILGLSMVAIISAFWLTSVHKDADGAVRVQFVGTTNDPALGPSALVCVSNQAVSLIFCARLSPQVRSSSGWVDVDRRSPSGLAWLQRGESYTFSTPVPAGAGPWRMAVWWRREDFTRLEEFANRLHRRFLVLCGEPNLPRDPWVPFRHVVYSPKIDR